MLHLAIGNLLQKYEIIFYRLRNQFPKTIASTQCNLIDYESSGMVFEINTDIDEMIFFFIDLKE